MNNCRTIIILLAALFFLSPKAQAIVVNVTVTQEGTLAETILRQTDDLESITQLTIHGPLEDNYDLDVLSDLKNLEVLDLSDAQMTTLSNCFLLTKLRKIILGESTTVVGVSACLMCSSLTEIIMPSVEQIYSAAFQGCTSLQHIDLPTSLKSVGEFVFDGCSALTDVYCYSPDYDGTLFNENTENVTLHVHSSLLDYFRQKENCEGVTVQGMDFMFSTLKLSKITTLTDISSYQGADVTFVKGENYSQGISNTMGALNLDAPSTPQWQIGTLSLPISFYDYETYFLDNDFSKYVDIYSIASLVNQRTKVEAETIEVKLSDSESTTWTFFSVPYDVNVDDIQGGRGNWIIRRYSGENRAAAKSGETWVDVKAGEQLHAYEGYIFCRDYNTIWKEQEEQGEYNSSEDDSRILLPAASTSNKQNIFATGDVVIPLMKHPARQSQNADWNLVGNPYPCYFELNYIKEQVDLYFYDENNDDYILVNTADAKGIFLAPCQSFFVQATDISHLTFQASGRRIQETFGIPEPDDNEEWSLPTTATSRKSLQTKGTPRVASSNLSSNQPATSTTFNPTSPLDPAANYYNPSTGELYMDLFQPGKLNSTIDNLINKQGLDNQDVNSLVVASPMTDADVMFNYFSKVISIDLGQSSGFSEIGRRAFNYLEQLKQLVLPACVTKIVDKAFYHCTALEQLTILATTPPTVESSTFTTVNTEDLVVLVPQEALAAYKAANTWKDLNLQPIGGGNEELQSLTIIVTTPDGQDLTEQCNILWKDTEGNLLGVGSQLDAQVVGNQLTYSVTLPTSLISQYEVIPEGSTIVQKSANVIRIVLVPTGVENLGTRDLQGSVGTLDFSYICSDKNTVSALEINDVLLTITDKSSGNELTDFVLDYPQLQFEQTQLTEGQVLLISASSRSNNFCSTSVESTIDADGNFSATLILNEYGRAIINCTREQGVDAITATIFDSTGKYVNRFLANGSIITVRDLPDGDYTAVVMQETQFFGTTASLSELQQTLLRPATDYVQTTICLKAGTTNNYNVSVPLLDESRLSHVSSNSYFVTNDASIYLTTSATLKAKVLFKEEYASRVTNLRLIITFPDDCSYVNGSIITAKSDGGHQLSGQRLVVPCLPDEQVRFCLQSNSTGEKSISAQIQYVLDGQQYSQPIGRALIEVQDLTLDLSEYTTTPHLSVSGYLTPDATVTLYDDDNVLGSFSTDSHGYFHEQVTLVPTFDGTFHNVYASFSNGENTRTTAATNIYLDSQACVLEEISMIYQDQRITWNELQHTVSPSYFEINPSKSGVTTFIAKFNNPQPEHILGPEFYVVASDGTSRVLYPTWDSTTQTYTATSDYPGTVRLPSQVDFIYEYANATPAPRTDMYQAEANYLQARHNQLVADIEELLQVQEVVADEEDHVTIAFTFGDDPHRFLQTWQIENYQQIDAMRKQNTFTHLLMDTDSVACYADGDDTQFIVYFVNFTTQEAYSIRVENEESPAVSRRISPIFRAPMSLLGKINFIGDINNTINSLKGDIQDSKDLLWSKYYLDEMKKTRENHARSLSNQIAHCQYLFWATCPDGSRRLPENLHSYFNSKIASSESNNGTFLRQLDGLIDSYTTALRNRIAAVYASNIATAGAGKLAKFSVSKCMKVIHNVAKTKLGTFKEIFKFLEDGATGAQVNLANNLVKEHFPTDFMQVKKFFDKFAPDGWYTCAQSNLALADEIKAAYKTCDPGEIDRPRIPWAKTKTRTRRRTRHIIDPSGYVYEGVESNRLRGVTATIYHKADAADDEQLWDATEFGQQNPLQTDASGVYMWNVPEGLWQVRFQKDGYQPTQTDWLPVPPPQLEIAIGMKPVAPPSVVTTAAYADAVSIHFSQYMQSASLNTISVQQNGHTVSGNIQTIDASDGLVRAIRFVPTEKFTAKSVQLTIPSTATSHTGATLTQDYSATLNVQHTIEGLLVQEGVTIEAGQTGYVTVTAYPAVAVAGKNILVNYDSPIIELLNSVTFDETGQALVPLRGILPGETNVTFAIGDLQANTAVSVKYNLLERCGRPIPTVAAGPVAAGTTVELVSSTPDAIIYYTTDGSCPCDEATRKRYDGPITISADVTLQAIAVHADMADSEVTTLSYSIATAIETPEAPTPLTIYEHYYDLRGQRQLPPLRRGIYIHIRRTETGTQRNKILIH